MDYEDALEATVSAKEAKREIEVNHCCRFDEFTAEHGVHDECPGALVLIHQWFSPLV